MQKEENTSVLDQELIEELEESKKKKPELVKYRPVLMANVNGKERLVDGRHRTKAKWPDKQKVTEIKNETDLAEARVVFMIQRRPSPAEQIDSIRTLCELYEKQGIDKKNIAKKVIETVSCNNNYFYELIADEYKHQYRACGEQEEKTAEEEITVKKTSSSSSSCLL